MSFFTNVIFDEITIGRSPTVSRTISRTDVEALTFIPDSPIYRQRGAHRGEQECLGLIKIFA